MLYYDRKVVIVYVALQLTIDTERAFRINVYTSNGEDNAKLDRREGTRSNLEHLIKTEC